MTTIDWTYLLDGLSIGLSTSSFMFTWRNRRAVKRRQRGSKELKGIRPTMMIVDELYSWQRDIMDRVTQPPVSPKPNKWRHHG